MNIAKDILAERGLAECYDIYEQEKQGEKESIVVDIVHKLVIYGDLTEKQFNFLGSLLDQIKNGTSWEEKRAAEKAAASPVPTSDERIQIEGTVLTTKWQENNYGEALKMLVKVDPDGYTLWGSVPAQIDDVEKGQKVSFVAKVQPSKDDPKFGFFSRPTKAKILQ